MERKLIDLRQQLRGVLDQAEVALTACNTAEFDRLMGEADRLNAEIDNYERLQAARGDFEDDNSHMISLHDVQQEQRFDTMRRSRIDNLRCGREYVTAWADAIRTGVSPSRAASMESMAPLINALTISGGDPVGSEGGFLAPIDFDNMLHEDEKDYFDLSSLFTSENVSLMSGWRAVATSGAAALPKIDESKEIGETSKPSFRKVSYSINKYGDRLPVSQELLNAEPGVLMSYISRWFAVRHVMTKNALLLALLNSLPATDLPTGSELSGLKTALNKGLSSAHARGASVLTNQSGYDALDQLSDEKGRPLLVPNPADPDTYRIKGKQIYYMDDDLLVCTSGKAPVYIGKFSAYGTLFERSGVEIASTDVGGNAWSTATPEIRALCYLDAQKVDPKAVVQKTYAVAE